MKDVSDINIEAKNKIIINFVGYITKVMYLCTEHLAVLMGVHLAPCGGQKNWFRATDGLSGHEFTVGAAPLAVLSRLFTASSPI